MKHNIKRLKLVPSSRAASNRMLATKRSLTSAELTLGAYLRCLGLQYSSDERLPDCRSKGDFVFTRARLVVFVDGCFWHACPKHKTFPKSNAEWWRNKLEANQTRDRRTTKLLRRMGWAVLRVWEHEIKTAPHTAAWRIALSVWAREHSTRLDPKGVKRSATDVA